MWNRKEIKALGKEKMMGNYFRCLAAGLVYWFFFGSSGSIVFNRSQDLMNEIKNDPDFINLLVFILAVFGVLIVIGILIRLFLYNPLEVGCNRFFLANQDAPAELGELGFSFKNNYKSAALGLFLRDLFMFIGFCLFIIPGIVLAYMFRMVPFILADDPQCGGFEAIKRSMAMMRGHKWRAFIFDLSFIGWGILSLISCGAVSVFYLTPYKMNADAALYNAIKGEAVIVEA